MRTCDVVVIGLGVMGLAALEALSRDHRVLGLERVSPGHTGGSSHGESRIFRLINFENPAYTPLARRSLNLWRGMERSPGEIFIPTGVIEAGPPGSAVIAGTDGSAGQGGGVVQAMTPAEVRAAFPAFHLPDHWLARFQADAGVVRADIAIARYRETVEARQPGSMLGVGARSVRQVGEGVEVVTDEGETIVAGAAVVTTGPWIADLVPELRGLVKVTLQTVGWFAATQPAVARPERMPVFIIETESEAGVIYGLPDVAGLGVKAATHELGPPWTPGDERPGEAQQRLELAGLEAVVAALMPEAAARLRASTTCLYTSTPDLEFVIDRRPEAPRIVFASACSGHGFKFAPAIGEMLAGMALDEGATSGFGLERLAV